jgi:hypothetical protein
MSMAATSSISPRINVALTLMQRVSRALTSVKDQITVFSGSVHPSEYYQQAVEEFIESAFDCEEYSPRATTLLSAVEEQWCLYVNL